MGERGGGGGGKQKRGRGGGRGWDHRVTSEVEDICTMTYINTEAVGGAREELEIKQFTMSFCIGLGDASHTKTSELCKKLHYIAFYHTRIAI